MSDRPGDETGRSPPLARLTSAPVLAGTLCLVWALTFVVQRVGLEQSQPLWFAAARVTVGALVLAPLLWFAAPLRARGVAVAMVLGLVQIAAFTGLQVSGLATVGAGPAATIVYTQPLLVLLGAWIVLGEPLTRRRLAGALLGFAGVAVVGVRELTLSGAGALLLLGAAVTWALGTLVTKAAAERAVLALVVWQHLVGAPVLLIVAALAERPPAPTATLAATVLFAGALGSALAWYLFTVLLGRGDAGVVTTWLFSVPILGAVLGVVLLGEPLGPALVVGVALVAAGVRLAAQEA